MELRVLNYFITVAKEGSISKAAEALHISQPSLSRQLMNLETAFGKQLLFRDNKGISLTEEGELLRRRAEEILTLANRTEAEIKEYNDIVSGEIHIGGGETQAMRLVVKKACDLREQYPNVRYHFYTGNSDDVLDRLDKGLLDFGLLIDPVNEKKYASIKLKTHDTWGVLMRKDSALTAKAAVEPGDMWGLPLILSCHDTTMDLQLNWLGKTLDEIEIAGTYNLIYNASMMVEEGAGYALCLDKLIYENESGSLCFRPLDPRQEIKMNLVWKKEKILSKAHKKFIEQFHIEDND